MGPVGRIGEGGAGRESTELTDERQLSEALSERDGQDHELSEAMAWGRREKVEHIAFLQRELRRRKRR